MTKRVLISIDWDYFINCGGRPTLSLKENHTNIYKRWYQEYLRDPGYVFSYGIHPGLDDFWKNLRQRCALGEPIIWISESHKFSYRLCRSLRCGRIVSFDAHSDLGYGGVLLGKGRVHCTNWLAELLEWKQLEKAQVVLGPYSFEKPADNGGKVSFCSMKDLALEEGEAVAGIHICRSGAWTPPWYDAQLTRFIELSEIKNIKGSLKERPWMPLMPDWPRIMETMLLLNVSHA